VTVGKRLRLGTAGVLVLAICCLVLPQILPDLPPHDPVNAKLLPPGTRVTAVVFHDGGTLTSPDVRVTDSAVVVRKRDLGHRDVEQSVVVQRETTREIPRDRVASIHEFRFWLGSDRFGRDVLRRALRGGRVSLWIASLSLLVSLAIGGSVGLAAASAGGIVDGVLMRLVDALMAFPILFLMILAATLFRPSPLLLVILLGCTSWMGVARLVRGQVLSLRTRPFILAARTSGSRWPRIVRTHYAPNLAGPLAPEFALRMGDLVIAEATLSFLGLGIPPTVPTWGVMVADGQRAMPDGWWLTIVPGVAIAWLVISLALIGDGLQQRGEPSA
jgi:peptide/nickel transport system permease protein